MRLGCPDDVSGDMQEDEIPRGIAKKVAAKYCEISLPFFLQILVKTRNNLRVTKLKAEI